MGKIFNALEKHRKERKDFADNLDPLQKQYLDALLQFNRRTGRLNIVSRSIIKDAGTVERLVSHQLIFEDGRITAAGEKKCEELTYELRLALAGSPDPDPIADPEPHLKTVFEALTPEPGDDLGFTIKPVEAEREQPPGDSPQGRINFNGYHLADRTPAADVKAPADNFSVKKLRESVRHDAGDDKEKGISHAASRPKPLIRPADPISTPKTQAILKADVDHTTVPATDVKQDAPPVLDPNLISLLAPRSFEAEQFKILRTNLLYPVSGTAPRSILVTSVSPEDGKSFVAANLAVSVALNVNRYVLLLDCDLRKPTIHSQFGFGNVPGLAEYLAKGASLPSLLLQTKVERLTILPGGTPPPNPSEILSSERMAALLEEVTNRYKDRLIIIDSPPPTMTAETGVLARMAEGIVLVARYSKTGKDDMKNLIEHLGKDKIVGCVLNQYDYRSAGFYGYRKYKKYGKTNYY
jgi:capsular exopolysaccharide synthesis family protein